MVLLLLLCCFVVVAVVVVAAVVVVVVVVAVVVSLPRQVRFSAGVPAGHRVARVRPRDGHHPGVRRQRRFAAARPRVGPAGERKRAHHRR